MAKTATNLGCLPELRGTLHWGYLYKCQTEQAYISVNIDFFTSFLSGNACNR